MKIDIGKLGRILGRLILAAPVVIAVMKPVIDAVKHPTMANVTASPPV